MMKNNLILGVQDFIKMLKGTFCIAVLCVMGFVDAKNLGEGVSTRTTLQPSAPAVTPPASPRVTTRQGVQPLYPVVSAASVNPFTGQQTVQRPIVPVSQYQGPAVKQPPLQIEATKAEEGGWFDSLFDYESYLTRLMPAAGLSAGHAVLAGVVGTTTAIFLGPTIAGYVGLMGALKLAGTALLLDRVGYSLRNGAITETTAVKMIKDGLEQRINDSGAYPTCAMQLEASSNGVDFVNNGQVDDRVFEIACKQLREEIKKNSLIILTDAKESLQQDAINYEIGELRKKYGSSKISEYVKNLESAQDANKLRAYVSEYIRSKNIVAGKAEKALQARKEAGKAEKALQVRKEAAEKAKTAAQQSTQPQAATSLWWPKWSSNVQ
jgi:hypothetical protein